MKPYLHSPGWILLVALVTLASALPAAAQLPPAGPPPYIPTSWTLVEAMLELGRVGPEDVVYDLGSGDGRIVIAAAERGARGVGIEYEDWLVERSWIGADSAGVRPQVHFVRQDVFESDVSDATVVMMYLGADFNLRLRPRLLEQLRPGSRIVSHAFHMGSWQADSTVTIGTGAERATLFYWSVPARVDGFWMLEIEGAQTLSLEFLQEFQMLQGQVRRGEQEVPLMEGRLDGEAVRFELSERQGSRDVRLLFSGRVIDGRLSGTVSGPPDWPVRRWTAFRFTDPSLAPP